MESAWLAGGIRSRKVTQARLESVAACDTHALKFLSLYYP